MHFNNICRDVELFLRGLKLDLPEIFPAPRRYRPAPVRFRRTSELSPAARRNAKRIIVARVKHWAGLMNVEYNRVAVKDQRTLWGSCSGRKNLNFNWRLAAAPPEALDYVVIHELCHLREMNHSKKFWALVSLACPDYAARRDWLKENYAALRHPDTAALLQPCREAAAGE
jgi:predicted metal-dependent hydrolase